LTVLDKLLALDRRWIFLFVVVALTIPFFLGLSCKSYVSPEAKSLYVELEKLRPTSKVLASFDYDPASEPELNPMAEAFLKYAFHHRFKVICLGLWPQGPLEVDRCMARVLRDSSIQALNLQYGIDYVNLGYQSGNEFAIQGMGSSIQNVFPSDVRGTRTGDIPIMQDVRDFSNVDFVFNLSAGYPGTVEWVQVGVDRYKVKLGAGSTAVQAPLVYPYLGSHQLLGLLGGMKGGAEFEALTGHAGKATKFMVSQTFAHLVVIFFIVLGNVAFFAVKAREKRQGGGPA
jgi:hypothetical protein